MSGYERMRRIIDWLEEHYRDQPSLGELADLAGLSESRFHREFVHWTGVTPKDFVQCLTLAHARRLLEHGEPVLEAATEAGLSGPGRLHDLCVSLEAASPGEIKSGGEGIMIDWGIAESPFGACLVGQSERGVCHLSFLDTLAENEAETAIARSWPAADLTRTDLVASDLVAQMFQPPSSQKPPGDHHLRLWVRGTEFQVRVWRSLISIPPGSLTTYRRIAEAIENPSASRAVGTAIGANSLAFLIPCHRVIRETGAISGYRWGVGRKRSLIAWEGAQKARL